MGFCHCQSCRAYSGAPATAFAMWKADNVPVTAGTDLVGRFNRAGMSERQFCTRCGGHLMTTHPTLGLTDISTPGSCRASPSGRAIVGALQFAALAALDAGSPVLRIADASLGVRREMEKEGRVFRDLVAAEAVAEKEGRGIDVWRPPFHTKAGNLT